MCTLGWHDPRRRDLVDDAGRALWYKCAPLPFSDVPVRGQMSHLILIRMAATAVLLVCFAVTPAMAQTPDAYGFTAFPTPTANSRPIGLASGPDGNIWFAELVGNRIGRVTPTGAIVEFPLPTANSQP